MLPTDLREHSPFELPLASGNLLLEHRERIAWSVYRLGRTGCTRSGAADGAHGFVAIGELCELLDSEFTLLRVARPWSVDDYAMGFEAVADIRHARRDVLRAYVQAQRDALEGLGSYTVDVLLSVRLPAPPRGLSASGMIGWLGPAEALVFDRVRPGVVARRAGMADLRRLVQRAFQRGLPDAGAGAPSPGQRPAVSEPDGPGAEPVPVLGEPARRFAQAGHALRIESHQGTSHQSFLRIASLGRARAAGDHGIEHVLNRLEAVEFPVDVAVSVRPSSASCPPVSLPREKLSPARSAGQAKDTRAMPFATVSLAVGAATAAELERRVVRLRRELSGVRLGRAPGEQVSLFGDHLPGPNRIAPTGRPAIPIEQLGPLRLRRSIVGSYAGPYLGFTAADAPRPVLFNPFEAEAAGPRRATLITGASGSGKTLCLELIMYQALIAGAAVIDLDLRGDHALERLPGVARQTAVVELSATSRFRGLLDPLRIAPDGWRERLAIDFLTGILPVPVSGPWQLEIAHAVRAVVGRRGRGCGEVVAELARGGVAARAAAQAIQAAVAAGPATLGYSSGDTAPADPEIEQVTLLRLRDVASAVPGTGRTRSTADRVDRAVARLITVYALRLAGAHRDRQCVLCLDDASSLIGDTPGRALLELVTSADCRADFSPVITLRSVEEVPWLAGRFSAALCFRVTNERQARKVAQLLRPGRSQVHLVRELVDARPGRCVMRDHSGRIDAVQVEFVDDRLLSALDTTPAGDLGGGRG